MPVFLAIFLEKSLWNFDKKDIFGYNWDGDTFFVSDENGNENRKTTNRRDTKFKAISSRENTRRIGWNFEILRKNKSRVRKDETRILGKS